MTGDQMSIEELLPTTARARRTDPDTSHEAAERVNARHMTAIQTRILRIGYHQAAFTDEWLADAWGRYNGVWGHIRVSPSGLRSRRAELVDAGLLEDSGARDRTAAGRACILWRITQAGLDRLDT